MGSIAATCRVARSGTQTSVGSSTVLAEFCSDFWRGEAAFMNGLWVEPGRVPSRAGVLPQIHTVKAMGGAVIGIVGQL